MNLSKFFFSSVKRIFPILASQKRVEYTLLSEMALKLAKKIRYTFFDFFSQKLKGNDNRNVSSDHRSVSAIGS